jgi:uncharacterized protein YuzE
MRVKYDKLVDAAYIYLDEEGESAKSAKMYACDPQEVGGMINLDFDDEGRLIGIEVLDASSLLPTSVLGVRPGPSAQRIL